MILPILAAALVLTGAAQELGSTPAAADALSELHRWNVLCMRLGSMARDKAWSPEVRRYADLLERERAFADVKLSELAGRLGLEVSALEIEPWEAARLEGMRELFGAEFDREFLAASVEANLLARDALQEARAVVAGEVRELVERLSPVVEQHHRLASLLSAGR